MWVYQKALEYPARVRATNPALAKNVITQYGGPDGELGASLRYLTQRYTMPIPQAKAALTDIGTEEWAPGCYLQSVRRSAKSAIPAVQICIDSVKQGFL